MIETQHPCEFCDTDQPQQEQHVRLIMKRNHRWYIFENVPARVCPNCGHRYYDGATLLRLEKLIKEHPEQLQPVEAWTFSLPQPE